jgi:hypothetical protein
MGGDVVASKAANFLVEDAALRDGVVGTVFDVAGVPQKPVDLVLAGFRKYYGGLWVGGRINVTASAISIAPNLMNRAVHHGLTSIELRLVDLESVEVLPGFVTKIIALRTPEHVVKIRCYGAPALAQQIRELAGRATT